MNAYFKHLQKNADKSIEVLSELPKGNFRIGTWFTENTATEIDVETMSFRNYYYCECCAGWIEGHADSEYINNINPMALAGRRGYSSKCRRCKYEISFNGMVS